MSSLKCYRVWMKDGCARLVDAKTERKAREIAVSMTAMDIKDLAMTPSEKRRALAVDYVTCLSE